jgi:signal peptidase I
LLAHASAATAFGAFHQRTASVVVAATELTISPRSAVPGLLTIFGAAMAPTLRDGDVVIALPIAGRAGPRRGNVVVFEFPQDHSLIYIMRVIGLPGEHVQVRHRHVYINGHVLDELYIMAAATYDGCSYCNVHVPHDSVFVLGDNRNNSSDSHEWGFVPIRTVLGRVVSCIWPAPHAGALVQPRYSGL